MNLVKTSRARNKIRQWFTQQAREDLEAKGRESLQHALKTNGLPHQKVSASPLLAGIIREMGFKKADDFYVAIGGGKIQVSQVVTKLIGRLKTAEVISPEHELTPSRRPQKRPAASSTFGIVVEGTSDPDVLVRMAKCCTPVPGDEVVGYISLGRGITIHREDCPNVKALKRTPERFTAVRWDDSDTATSSFRVTIALQSWDRPRLLEDVARTFAEHGANIVEYGGHVADQMARNWYTAEVGDVKELRALLQALRNIDSVFDAYRVTPGG
jgi:GTP pyrophosphokinase